MSRTTAAGTPCASSAAVASALVRSAAHASISAWSSAGVRDPPVAGREPLVRLELGPAERREDTAGERVGRGAQRDVAVGRGEDPERREPRHPFARPHLDPGALHRVPWLRCDERGQRAEQRRRRRAGPRPVRSRRSSAETVPITAKSGPIRSPNGTPLRTGGSP